MTPDQDDYHRNPESPLRAFAVAAMAGLALWCIIAAIAMEIVT